MDINQLVGVSPAFSLRHSGPVPWCKNATSPSTRVPVVVHVLWCKYTGTEFTAQYSHYTVGRKCGEYLTTFRQHILARKRQLFPFLALVKCGQSRKIVYKVTASEVSGQGEEMA